MALNTTVNFDDRKSTAGITARVCIVNGAWQEWVEGEPVADMVPKENTGTVTVARLNNKSYSDYVQNQVVLLGRARNKKDTDQMNAIINRAIAKHIVMGWSDFEENGAPLKYTEKNVKAKLEKDPDFKSFVLELADIQDRYTVEVVKEQGKNL